MKRVFVATAVVSALFTTSAQAQQIVTPVSAVASSTNGPDYTITNTINQSGLFTGYTPGVTNFDTYVAGNPLHATNALTEWYTEYDVNSAVVTYDFGAATGTDRLALWNEESVGMGSFILSGSLDNITYTTLGTFMPVNNPDTPGSFYGPQLFSYTATNARYLRFDISGCPQSGNLVACAIGEVAFRSAATSPDGVPEPATWAMLLLGFGGVGYSIRRRPAVGAHRRLA